MANKGLPTTLSCLIRILETLKDDEFVLSVPLADAQSAGTAEGGAADQSEHLQHRHPGRIAGGLAGFYFGYDEILED